MNRSLVESGYAIILQGLFGEGWKGDEHLRATPQRAAKAMVDELCVGVWQEPPQVTVFEHKGDTGLVMLKNIPVRSLCAHHLLPFIGVAHVGYITEGLMVGLSKLSRIVDHISRQPQVQERLTSEIADFLYTILPSNIHTGVGVVIQANHMCMALRGVKHDGDMVTSALRGVMQEPEVRAEFLKLAGV